ncbi:serine hydrolase domain-containing protein [Winogradskyella tangerina]|uniref:serine hydrolase domain-containing protein n=1 Tax=Winogradskyella tangerina TaxID=2023240 RepID=UPI000DBE4C04|nr:serine hydrolase domain-containing protein [Winogradskyella tangerina]
MKSIKKLSTQAILVVLVFSGLCAFTQDNNTTDIEKKIDEIFKNYNDINKPGAAVAVVSKGEVVFKKGYGSAQLEYDIPVTPSTVFHIASVSKQFTVYSILLLEQQGKLSFDDDIRKHIPEVPDFGTTITLRHLASHTSGMRDQWSLLNLAGWRWDDVITKEHIMKMVKKQKELNFQPGEEYVYCNTGFTLLAEVVARISGKSFAEFTHENIFAPLKMNKTLFYDDHEKIVKDRAYSYYNQGGNYKKSVLSYANVGATSLFTTVEDLALWSMHLNRPKDDIKDIVSKMNTLAVLNNGSEFGGAYGQFVNDYKGLKQIQHGGADAGYRSYLGRFPEQDFAVMVFSNLAQANPTGLALQVADLFLEDQFEVQNSSDQNNQNQKDDAFIVLSNKELKAFEGSYWNEPGSYARRIYVKNDTLMYNRGASNESKLAPVASNKFKMLNVGVDLYVDFTGSDNNKIMTVVINNEDPIISEEFTPPNYNATSLKEFAGSYYSEELSTTYDFIVKDDQLVGTHSRASDFGLSTAKPDVFIIGGNIIKFLRDKDKSISGLTVTTGRVRNLFFERID